ncbi:hypothetical protein HA466_0017730 [Hirschfeldia incana]|nr:hypothetical protein HA466_0017730 [Hirschfeldia incana]
MGSENHEVVDVSSDEEEVEVVDRDYSSWLNRDKSDSSSDVFEVKGSVEADDDDDCVILDCDPDKTTSAAVEADDDDDDDDEVLVVGQKGEIACRDFPHPRHSCAKYSFNSTSHESYCDMCHCYVCDIPAPCPYWCVAASSVDHCHANDKDKTWMTQRQFFRTGVNIPTIPPPAHATVSPPQSIIRLSQNPRNKIEIRPCSSSSSTRVANNLSNARGRSRLLRQSFSSSSVSIQKDRSSYMGSLRHRVASSGTTRSYGNSVKAGVYTNAKVSRSTHHPSVVAPPTISPEMYRQQQQQQGNSQLNVTDYGCAAAVTTGSQSNADLFTLPEWGPSTVQQQPGTNENVLQSKLSEVESWLMDSCNQPGLVSPLPEPVGQDSVTFDFETFLND